MTHVIGIDLSLTSTGLAWDEHLTQRVRTKPADGDLERLRAITSAVADAARGARLAVIEGPSYGSKWGHDHTRAGCWWMVADVIDRLDVPLLVVSPSSLKMYATGRGNANKDEVLAAVISRYPDRAIDGSDVADALVLCALGRRMLGDPIEASMPLLNLRALAKLALP